MSTNNFAHKAAYNTTRGVYATADAVTKATENVAEVASASYEATKLVAKATFAGLRSGFAEAKDLYKRQRAVDKGAANRRNSVRVVGE